VLLFVYNIYAREWRGVNDFDANCLHPSIEIEREKERDRDRER